MSKKEKNQIAVESYNEKSRLSRFFSKKNLLVFGPLLVILILVGFGLWLFVFGTNKNTDILAKVGSENITKADLNKGIYGRNFSGTENNPQKILTEDKNKLLEELILFAIAEGEAKKLGITVTDEEINKDIESEIGLQFANYTAEQKKLTLEGTRHKLLLEKVKNAELGWREGDFLAFNFHKYVIDPAYAVTGQGDEALIKNQRTAALALANKISTDLRNQTITLSQAKQQLISDPNIGTVAMMPRSPVMFSKFTKDDFLGNTFLFSDPSIKDIVYNLKKNEASQPMVDRGAYGGKTIEYRYLVIAVKEASNGIYKTEKEWLEAKKKEYKVTKNTDIVASLFKIIPLKKAFAALGDCNKCNTDNANLKAYFRVVHADNSTYEDLKFKDGYMIFRGGASGDPALAPNSSGSACGNRRLEINSGTTGTPGYQSLCNLSYSYFCKTQSVAYIKFPQSVGTNNSNNSILADTFPSQGTWTWYEKDAANNGNIGDAGNGIATAGLNLGEDANGGSTRNGDTVTNKFTWHPLYSKTLAIHKDGNGSGNISTNNNVLGNNISMSCSPTCADKDLKFELNKVVQITAIPATGTNVTFSAGSCTSVADGVGGAKTCTTTMDANKTITVTFTNNNGVCGTADGVPAMTKPTSGLCSSGTASAVVGDGSNWTWFCTGTGGTVDNCSAAVETGPTFGCTINPDTGLSPLVANVKAWVSDRGAGAKTVSPKYKYNFDLNYGKSPALKLLDLSVGDAYYTYPNEGVYKIYYKITDKDVKIVTNLNGSICPNPVDGWCQCGVKDLVIKKPSNKSLKEVAP